MNRKKLIVFLICSGAFVSCVLTINLLPTGITKSLNNCTLTSDGVKIYYDLFIPKDDTSTNKTGIILGHGIMVNKQFLRTIAMDLANHGFVVAALDFRGHGRSGGGLGTGNITTDIIAIKNVLSLRGDINMSNLGYLGYSMGGGAGFQLLTSDSDFRAMVSLASSGSSPYNPPNLLILHGKIDEVVNYQDVLQYIENRTGISAENVQPGMIYGSITDGNATKLILSNTDHLFAPYSLNNILETRIWFLQTLKNVNNPPTEMMNYGLLLVFVLLATSTGISAFILVAAFFVKKLSIQKSENEEALAILEKISQKDLRKQVIKSYWYIVVPLSIPGVLFGAFSFVLPIYFMSLIVILLSGNAAASFFYLWYLLKKKHNVKFGRFLGYIFRKSSIRNVIIGIGLGLILYAVLGLSIGYIFGIVPGVNKWGWAAFYWIFMFLIVFSNTLFFRTIYGDPNKTFSGKFKELGLVTAMSFIPITIIVLISVAIFRSLFNIQFLIPMFPLILLINAIAIKLYNVSRDIVLSSLLNSVMLTIFAISLSFL
ncbi:MAG: alpha/beta fold hydrolase [Candidatus Lokiarchaeota archaeon]|nr:alpha/beta fold hydrolase [Candidatus Lokiarchaeota archaeon]